MNVTLRRIDVGSVFKITFVLYGILGLLMAFLFAIFFLISAQVGMGRLGLGMGPFGSSFGGIFRFGAGLGAFLSFFLWIFSAVLYALLGASFTSVAAAVYNLLAASVGGIRMSLEAEEAARWLGAGGLGAGGAGVGGPGVVLPGPSDSRPMPPSPPGTPMSHGTPTPPEVPVPPGTLSPGEPAPGPDPRSWARQEPSQYAPRDDSYLPGSSTTAGSASPSGAAGIPAPPVASVPLTPASPAPSPRTSEGNASSPTPPSEDDSRWMPKVPADESSIREERGSKPDSPVDEEA